MARERVARRYSAGLADVAIVPKLARGSTSVWAQYTIRLPEGRRDALAAALNPQGIPTAIYAEAVLAIIGFGLEPPTASLGTLVYDGYIYFRANEWMLAVPAASIATLTLCFTFLGDGLRDALDPRTRR